MALRKNTFHDDAVKGAYELHLIPPTYSYTERGSLVSPQPMDSISVEYPGPDMHGDSKHHTFHHRFVGLEFWHKIRAYTLLDSKNDNTGRPHHRGWRKGVIAAIVITGAVFFINLFLSIIAAVKYGAEDGVGLIVERDCTTVKRWNTALHLFINLLSTVLLAASNYTMQCLASPTRSEVQYAHDRGVSLDIGIFSVKNFLHMRRLKAILWGCLCLSTLPLHILWNSTIFATTAATDFSYLVVNESYFQWKGEFQLDSTVVGNETFCSTQKSIQTISDFMYTSYSAGNYTNISASDCFKNYRYGDGGSSRNLMLVTKADSSMRTGSCGALWPNWNGSSIVAMGSNFTQGTDWVTQSENKFVPPSLYYQKNAENITEQILKQIKDDNTWYLGSYPIHYCLSEKYVAICKLQYASFILYIVLACNAIKVACMTATVYYLWDLNEPILATIGDAAASFLDEKDRTTAGICLVDHTMVRKCKSFSRTRAVSRGYGARNIHIGYEGPFAIRSEKIGRLVLKTSLYRRKPKTSLSNTVSDARTFWTSWFGFVFWLAGFIVMCVSLQPRGTSDLLGGKFGVPDKDHLLGIDADSGTGLFVAIIVANSVQVIFSTIYILYNSLLTAQWSSIEWAQYAQQKLRPLRVTWPRGKQRSTYFLQLPWKYGLPLLIMQVLMHFLISQSIFLARAKYYDPVGNLNDESFSNVGYSPRAMLATCCVWFAVVFGVMINGRRKINNIIPSHGNESAVISALCHAIDGGREQRRDVEELDNKDNAMSARLLMWGVTRQPGEYDQVPGESPPSSFGHCSFTDELVDLPVKNSHYI